MRIQQAIPAKHKSPACENLRDARRSPSRPARKTRPPAEYDACAALPCPDIEIGLRRPVNYRVHGRGASQCDPFHNRHKKVAAGSLRRRGTAQCPASGLPRTGNGVSVAIGRVCDAWRCILIGSSCFVSSADWMLRETGRSRKTAEGCRSRRRGLQLAPTAAWHPFAGLQKRALASATDPEQPATGRSTPAGTHPGPSFSPRAVRRRGRLGPVPDGRLRSDPARAKSPNKRAIARSIPLRAR